MKFRIWDIKNKRMIVDEQYFIGMDGSTHRLMNGELVEFREAHIILYDKNFTDHTGQQVFDGDIILYKNKAVGEEVTVKTVTKDDTFHLQCKAIKIGNRFETSQYDLEKNKIELGRSYGWL